MSAPDPRHVEAGANRHTLRRPFIWPATAPGEPSERITIGEAIPRWIRTTGCTWDEALGRVGVSYRTAELWMRTGGQIWRRVSEAEALGLSPPVLEGSDVDCLDLYRSVSTACAEVVVRWQAILEREGRGGYPAETRTVVTKTNPATGEILERIETIKTEIVRPDTDVIRWKMRKQIDRYRDKDIAINVLTSPVILPEPTDDEVAGAAVVSLRQFQEAMRNRAIEAASTVVDDPPISLD